jgi:hypothetical protein
MRPVFRFLSRFVATLWNTFVVGCVVIVTPIFLYLWASGEVVHLCGEEGLQCWLMAGSLTAMSVAMFLVCLLYIAVRWSKRLRSVQAMPFTEQILGPWERQYRFFAGLRIAREIHQHLGRSPQFRTHAVFAGFVHLLGWLCTAVAVALAIGFLVTHRVA